MMVLSLPLIISALGLGALIGPLAYMGGVTSGISFNAGIILTIIILVMEIVALPGLFKRQKSAWNILFYVSLVSALSSILSFNLLGLIIGTLLSWYFLFQIRSYYK